MIRFDIGTIQTSHDFFNYISEQQDIDVKGNLNQIITCLMNTVFRDQYLVFGKVDLYQGVEKIIAERESPVRMCSPLKEAQSQRELDFFRKLQPHLKRETVDTTITQDVFSKVNEHNIFLRYAQNYNSSIKGITYEQAIEFACIEGPKLTKINRNSSDTPSSSGHLNELV